MKMQWINEPREQTFEIAEMYEFVKKTAEKKGMEQTGRALPFAKEKHKGQFRKGKEKVPYIYHPLLVACHALALGFDDDKLIASALLHDVCEDCGVRKEELPVGDEAKNTVLLLTKTKKMSVEDYYAGIRGNKTALIIKILDRCSNISSMSAAFSEEKLVSYTNFTEKWVLPMTEYGREKYPEYTAQFFLLEYHMRSVLESLKYKTERC